MLSCVEHEKSFKTSGQGTAYFWNFLLCVTFYVCVFFVIFPCGVLSQVWYLIISISDLCLLIITYFNVRHILHRRLTVYIDT